MNLTVIYLCWIVFHMYIMYNCECGSILQKRNKKKHETSQKHRKWISTREIQSNSNIYNCECGSNIKCSSRNIQAHLRTKKHIYWIQQQVNQPWNPSECVDYISSNNGWIQTPIHINGNKTTYITI